MDASQRTRAKWLRSGAGWALSVLLLCGAVAWIVSDEPQPQAAALPGAKSIQRALESQRRRPVTRVLASEVVVPANEAPGDSVSDNHGERASLTTEVALLERAVRAIARGDPRQALHAIHEHRARVAHPLLSEERDGLSIIAHCLAGDAGAARRARRGHRRAALPSPSSVPFPERSRVRGASGRRRGT